jgi:hypothetical protein
MDHEIPRTGILYEVLRLPGRDEGLHGETHSRWF